MTAILPLRDYQLEAIRDLHQRWDAGDTRVPMVLATGLGKTVIFAHLIADWVRSTAGKRVIVLVHTDELVQQAYKKIKDVAPGLHVGIVKAERNEVTARVIVASVQSLRAEKRRNQIRNVGMIIVDECFPAGTLIGDKPIESLKPGDLVPSWDEATGQEVMRPVVALMKSVPSGIVQVTMDDGTDFACTPNHPIMTTSGWCPAGGLWRGAHVVSFAHDADARSELYGVRGSGDSDPEGSDRFLSPERSDVLPGSLSGHVGRAGSVGQDGADEPSARVGTYEDSQSDAQRGNARQDGSHPEGDQPQAEHSGREWETDPRTSGEACSASRMAGGSDRGAEGWRDALALQDRYRAPDDEGMRGGGRGVPLLAGPPRLRPAEGRKTATSRVVGIQVLQPGSDGTYSGVCPDGFVYNIEVAGTHTYLVGERGTIAHNCHHAVAKTYWNILNHFGAFGLSAEEITPDGQCPDHGEYCACIPEPAIKVAGFTATLARGDKQKLSDVWQECTFQRGIAFGIRRGYLLDVRGKRIVIPDLDLTTVKKSGGDYQDAALGDALDFVLAPQRIAESYLKYASDRKGLAFWPLVRTAEHGAQAFNEAGIPSAVVHGGTPREERRLILKKLHTGEIQVVHNCGVLTEGFDEPTVSCVVNARPTQSAPLYQQMVGRGLRPDLSLPPESRGDCLVLDVVGVSRTHNLRTLIDLSSREVDDASEDLSLLELEDMLDAAEAAERDEKSAEEPPEYYGAVAAEDFDPLARTGIGAWLKTAGGTFFLPIGKEAYVLIVESEDPGQYDVAWLTQSGRAFYHMHCPGQGPYLTASQVCTCGQGHVGAQGDLTEHRGLSLDMACSWAEEVLEELGGSTALLLAGTKKAWRRDKEVSEPQRALAARLGITLTGQERKGEVADLISAVLGSQRIDPVVAFMQASRG